MIILDSLDAGKYIKMLYYYDLHQLQSRLIYHIVNKLCVWKMMPAQFRIKNLFCIHLKCRHWTLGGCVDSQVFHMEEYKLSCFWKKRYSRLKTFFYRLRSYKCIKRRSPKSHLLWEHSLMCPGLCGDSSRTSGVTDVWLSQSCVALELVQVE